ncbi:MAG: hypothetical protein GTN62_04165 [Gemmatimonadales bacterium]|nr:hypothetical protein [Gemmatimonadales bacterium]NIN10507.1 hypothetical protein [Gemmatimonadales bacterium]NIN49294.1 hypothetical protein [Gemmatimonadales bacterium]NIP06758.1 hypothetical protein [Gemmatimonadales bacterium]NIR02784.1 hypothetical protein [Gemmatimonadales bacterium]
MRWLSTVAGGALAAVLVAAPQPALGQGLMVTGYADLEIVLGDVNSDDREFFFDNHHFNIIALGKLVEDVFAAVEVEYEHGGGEIALEYGYISYTGIRNLRISGGKFIVPFGRFNKDLHPTWINKMPDRPHGFRDIFPQTYSDVGIWLSGGAPVGTSGARVTYDAFVVNGLGCVDCTGIRGMRPGDDEELRDQFDGVRDDGKSVGGRLGIELAPQGFDFGASGYYGSYDPVNDLNLAMFGVDAAFRYRALELRAEGVLASQDAVGGDLTKKGGYAQAAYLIQRRFEPVVRFSMRDMPGDDSDAWRLSFGASFYVSASAAIRLAYHHNDEKAGFDSDNDDVIAQFTMSF